jgi:hypothetical protein
MAKTRRKCAFCDAAAVWRGGEHLWDDWLNKELPKKIRFNAKRLLFIDSPPIEFVQIGLQEKIPSVCTGCNNGWMSDLTAKMKDRFSSTILEGAPFSLDAKDAVLLAAFTLMKGIVQNYHYWKHDPFFTRVASERLRSSLTIPPYVKMWVAAHQASSRYAFHSNFHTVTVNSPGPLGKMEFFSYTYIAGNLVTQLLAPRWKDIRHRSLPLLNLTPNIRWQPAAPQFWPYAGKIIPWPPEKYIGDSMIEKFINRFQSPINIPIR